MTHPIHRRIDRALVDVDVLLVKANAAGDDYMASIANLRRVLLEVGCEVQNLLEATEPSTEAELPEVRGSKREKKREKAADRPPLKVDEEAMFGARQRLGGILATDFPCDECGAKPGFRCTAPTNRGGALKGDVVRNAHRDRKAKADEARKEGK